MAYEMLITKGLIKRIKGKGTYVTNRPIYHTDMHSFYQIEFTHVDHQVVVLLERSNKDISAMRELGLHGDDKYYSIMRLYYDNRNPVVLQRAYLPKEMYPNLDQQTLENYNVYQLIEDLYRIQIEDVKSTFSPANVSQSDALLLNIEPDDAIYLVRSKALNKDHQVVAYICNYYPGEFTEFEVIVHAK
jgi:GntR family transcriptional regulator